MAIPLYIKECFRRSGETFLTVAGHGLTAADEGKSIAVTGVAVADVNVTAARITKIIPPDTIRFKQPGKDDIPVGISGGACAIT